MQRSGARSRAQGAADAEGDLAATQDVYQAPSLARVDLAGLDALFQVLNGLILTSLKGVEHLLQRAALRALPLEIRSHIRQFLALLVTVGLELPALLGQLVRLVLQLALALLRKRPANPFLNVRA